MNSVILTGRLTSRPELRYTSSNMANTNFSLAVDRNFKNQNGEVEVDFINCMAWNKLAETITKYCDKGNKIMISGRIQVSSYENETGKHYVTKVIADKMEFISKNNTSKDNNGLDKPKNSKLDDEVFKEFGEQIMLDESDLPFN